MQQTILTNKNRYEFYLEVSSKIAEINSDDKAIISVITFFDELAETNVCIINFH